MDMVHGGQPVFTKILDVVFKTRVAENHHQSSSSAAAAAIMHHSSSSMVTMFNISYYLETNIYKRKN